MPEQQIWNTSDALALAEIWQERFNGQSVSADFFPLVHALAEYLYNNGQVLRAVELLRSESTMDRELQIDYVDIPETLKGKYQYFTQAEMGWLREKNCPVAFSSLEKGIDDYVCNYLASEDPYLEMC